MYVNGEIKQLIINIKYHIYCTKILGKNMNIILKTKPLQHKFYIDRYMTLKNASMTNLMSVGEWLHLFSDDP